MADAILHRIVHNAYRLELDGPSMRKLANEAEPDARSPTKEAVIKQPRPTANDRGAKLTASRWGQQAPPARAAAVRRTRLNLPPQLHEAPGSQLTSSNP